MLEKRTHPKPTRRKPPRKPGEGRAPLKLSKAGARGLKESLDKNSPKTPKYYHIPRGPRIRASEVAALVICVALAMTVLWSFSCVHRLGYDAGRADGWGDGYEAAARAVSGGQGL